MAKNTDLSHVTSSHRKHFLKSALLQVRDPTHLAECSTTSPGKDTRATDRYPDLAGSRDCLTTRPIREKPGAHMANLCTLIR